ncbi:MAG: 16S rRNA (uracil(1498)-N(3))-methyltransferase [Clostridiales bacterium]|nr:16S rRNA (uracil(1498)-N(3))-methyltransferase [Clostridiales bacterium]
MKRFYVDEQLQVNSIVKIEGIEHNHIKNVMRMKVGDEIVLVCGDDYDYLAKITELSKGETKVFVSERQQNLYNPIADLTVYQALVKSDNMSLIVQKLTELGVKTFVPFESDYITSKDKMGKVGKLQDISNQSIKQCKRSIPMDIKNTMTFGDMVKSLSQYDIVIFANECEKVESLGGITIDRTAKVAIIIGSEGGFSENEIRLLNLPNVRSISLGKRILRAETAAIALSAVVISKMGEWDV